MHAAPRGACRQWLSWVASRCCYAADTCCVGPVQAELTLTRAQLQRAAALQTTIEALKAQLASASVSQAEVTRLREKLVAAEAAQAAAERELSTLKAVHSELHRMSARCVCVLGGGVSIAHAGIVPSLFCLWRPAAFECCGGPGDSCICLFEGQARFL